MFLSREEIDRLNTAPLAEGDTQWLATTDIPFTTSKPDSSPVWQARAVSYPMLPEQAASVTHTSAPPLSKVQLGTAYVLLTQELDTVTDPTDYTILQAALNYLEMRIRACGIMIFTPERRIGDD